MIDLYEQLAQHLDNQPGGYPRTESGVEMRILRRLFTPAEAGLALHLTLVAEEPRVVAYRAGLPVEEVAQCLAEMERKGLIFCLQPAGGSPAYAIQQFVVGFWEGQVNRLDKELVEDVEEYLPIYQDPELWRKAPQLRTIPVGESIAIHSDVMDYESAETLVRRQRTIAVANCICRQELHVLDQGCDKPLETCLSFGVVAESYIRNGRGRAIDQEEALAILRQAEQVGLILQPSNAQDALSICACCGCCCGVLRSLKRHPKPASLVASPFIASLDADTCAGCGTCETRCQMQAISLPNGLAELNLDRCIGCGLCVSTCPTGSLILTRKPAEQQPFLPKDLLQNYLQMGQARGKLGRRDLVNLMVKSKKDRQAAAERQE